MSIGARFDASELHQSAAPAFRRAVVYADGAKLEDMIAAYRSGTVGGFTTNPTLLAKAGVRDYRAFARRTVEAIPDLPISFEVLADEFEEMARQAREISSWGDNVFVKVPIMNTAGQSAIPLIRELSQDGVKQNVTAVMTLDQVRDIVDAIAPDVPTVCSIFAGRIADTGRDPVPIMREAVNVCATNPSIQVLWASPREVLNIYQAEECGCHIITVTNDLLDKLKLCNKDLVVYSRETVQMFFDDACRAGLTLEPTLELA
jgi:transaldolase